jgi:(1->4)-alpha-D-glucan 1-alpha-D-glucosylmutase
MLAHGLKRVADQSRNARDFTLPSLTRVIRETMAAFPVYRTYVKQDGLRQANDEHHISTALEIAKQKNPRVASSLFDFLRDVLLLREGGERGARFAMKFQQVSGPIMAKGLEDTAHYRYNRLVCLNEVGCDASRFGESIETFHAHNARILSRWPLSMTTTSTHDTKRSEDVRARLAVLSEVPDEWHRLVERLDGAARAASEGVLPVSNADAHLFYQTVVGAFPFEPIATDPAQAFEDRIASYLQKAVREAKLATSWATPNVAYEQALDVFIRGALRSPSFIGLAKDFVGGIVTYGATNSLAQLALRLAAPGVPDVYQGCELWTLTLVDPDNRVPVDFVTRSAMLAEMKTRADPTRDTATELVAAYADGRIKMYTTWRGLALRRAHPALFLEGSYEPIVVSEHVVAFERSHEGQRLVCVVPRFVRTLTGGREPWGLGDVWGDVTLPLGRPGKFRDVFTGACHEGVVLRLADVFSAFPVAWLLAT